MLWNNSFQISESKMTSEFLTNWICAFRLINSNYINLHTIVKSDIQNKEKDRDEEKKKANK